MIENYGIIVLISTTVARIGAILLLIFGAQVLINFYQYNLRLAAFYDARADAIELLGDSNIDGLPVFVSNLSPEQVHMGKSPKTPSQEVFELMAAIQKLQK